MTEKPCYIIPSSKINAQELCGLTQANEQRWTPYFPQTVALTITLEKATSFLKGIQEDEAKRTQFLFGLRAVEDDALKGIIYLKELDWDTKKGEFAYAIDTSVARRGWISQAIRVLAKRALGELGLERLEIFAHRTNLGSVGVAKNCGFVHEQTVQNAYTPPGGTPMNMELYTMIK